MRTLVILVWTVLLVSCATYDPYGSVTGPTGATWSHPTAQGRTTLAAPALIPDGDPSGVTLGPRHVTDDGGTMQDVGLHLAISHGCTGDVSVWLCYDADRDGRHDASAPVEFYRARLGGYNADPTFADPKSLDGDYYFRGHEFSVFDGLKKGGSFYLVVIDTLDQCVGSVQGWTINFEASTSVVTRDVAGK